MKKKITLSFHLSYPFQSIRKYPIPTGRKLSNIYLSSEFETQTKMILEVSYQEDNNNGILTDLSIYIQDAKNKTKIIFVEVKDRKSSQENHRLSINLKWFANNFKTIEKFRRMPNRRDLDSLVNESKEEDLKSFNIPNSKDVETNSQINKKFSVEGKDDVVYVLNYFFNNQNNYISGKDLDDLGFKDRPQYYPKGRELIEIEHFIRYGLLKEAGYHFENTEYVEAVRAKSRRIYTHDSQSTLFDELLLDYNSVQLEEPASSFLKKWIREFEIADDVRFEKISGGVATLVIFTKNGVDYPLADLGYGVTQYLPLLLKIALQVRTESSNDRVKTPFREKPLKKIIIVEEPETNLHPKLQSRLADMFLDALTNFEIKFIIETHSEYFIRRLQILIAEKKTSPDNLSLYYFYEPSKVPSGRKQVEKISILADGNLDNDFGEGFFDEATKMKFDLLKKKSKKS